MCVVIDTCVFSAFWDATNQNHSDFKPVLKWVTAGKGKIVYGGSKYKKELRKEKKFFRFLVILERSNKIVFLCDAKVDKQQIELKKIEPSEKFDDPHLVAILLESKCKIICTNDKKAIPYLKDPRFFKKAADRPRIYQTKNNKNLLTDRYIAEICKNCHRN